jgi:hypothetical protein
MEIHGFRRDRYGYLLHNTFLKEGTLEYEEK